jgi:hypothetical protein
MKSTVVVKVQCFEYEGMMSSCDDMVTDRTLFPVLETQGPHQDKGKKLMLRFNQRGQSWVFSVFDSR